MITFDGVRQIDFMPFGLVRDLSRASSVKLARKTMRLWKTRGYFIQETTRIEIWRKIRARIKVGVI